MIIVVPALAAPSAVLAPAKERYCEGELAELQVDPAGFEQVSLWASSGRRWIQIWHGEGGEPRTIRLPLFTEVDLDPRFLVMFGSDLDTLPRGCAMEVDPRRTSLELVVRKAYCDELPVEPVFLDIDKVNPEACEASTAEPWAPVEVVPTRPDDAASPPSLVLEHQGVLWDITDSALRRRPVDALDQVETVFVERVRDLRCRPEGPCLLAVKSPTDYSTSLYVWDPVTTELIEGQGAWRGVENLTFAWQGEEIWFAGKQGIGAMGLDGTERTVTELAHDGWSSLFDGLPDSRTTFYWVDQGELRWAPAPESIHQRDGDFAELSLLVPWERGSETFPAGALVRIRRDALETGVPEVLVPGDGETLITDWKHTPHGLLALRARRADVALERIVDGESEVLLEGLEFARFGASDGVPLIEAASAGETQWIRVLPDGSLGGLDGPYQRSAATSHQVEEPGFGARFTRLGSGAPALVDVTSGRITAEHRAWVDAGGTVLVSNGDVLDRDDPARSAFVIANHALQQGWVEPGELVALADGKAGFHLLAYFHRPFAAIAAKGWGDRESLAPVLQETTAGPPFLVLSAQEQLYGSERRAALALRNLGARVNLVVTEPENHLGTALTWLRKRAR